MPEKSNSPEYGQTHRHETSASGDTLDCDDCSPQAGAGGRKVQHNLPPDDDGVRETKPSTRTTKTTETPMTTGEGRPDAINYKLYVHVVQRRGPLEVSVAEG